jgi:hypothetical protein
VLADLAVAIALGTVCGHLMQPVLGDLCRDLGPFEDRPARGTRAEV